MMASSIIIKTSSPLKTGRLSLLSSDIEEDLGLIDFNESQFEFLSEENIYWLFDYENDDSSFDLPYDIAFEWLNSVFTPQDNDSYFELPQTNTSTPRKNCSFVYKQQLMLLILVF